MLTKKPEYSVLILGLEYAGKTALLEQLKVKYLKQPSIAFEKLQPTVGLNVAKLQLQSMTLNVLDLGGMFGLRKIWNRYFDDCHAVIFVVDSVDLNRMTECLQTLGMCVCEEN